MDTDNEAIITMMMVEYAKHIKRLECCIVAILFGWGITLGVMLILLLP